MIQDVQVGADPGGHRRVAGGETGAGAQGVFPLLGAVGVEAKEGGAVIVEHLIAKRGHLLGHHAAQLLGGQLPGTAPKDAQDI